MDLKVFCYTLFIHLQRKLKKYVWKPSVYREKLQIISYLFCIYYYYHLNFYFSLKTTNYYQGFKVSICTTKHPDLPTMIFTKIFTNFSTKLRWFKRSVRDHNVIIKWIKELFVVMHHKSNFFNGIKKQQTNYSETNHKASSFDGISP